MVPIQIAKFKEKGGPTDTDYAALQHWNEDMFKDPEHIIPLMFNVGKKGEATQRINDLVYVVSVLAFLPGGVELFGTKFEATVESSEEEEVAQ
jgi:hypothetical protein